MTGAGTATNSGRLSQNRSKRIRRHWQEWFAVALGGAILGQAMIYHQAAPFVAIFALLIWEKRRIWFAPFTLGGLTGMIFGPGWMSALVLLGWTLLVPLPWQGLRWGFSRWPLLGLGSAAVFMVGKVWTSYELTLGGVIAAGALALYYLLWRELERIAGGDFDRSTLVLVLASLACFIAGLAGIQIWHLNPSLFIGGLVVLAASALQGAAGGAVAGATLGVTLALRGGGHDLVGILVGGGFFSGWLQRKHWRLASVGLLLGVLLYAVFIQLPKPLEPFWISLAACAALFQFLPQGYLLAGQHWVESLAPLESREIFQERMVRIADVMKEMARAFRVDDDEVTPEIHLVQAVVDGVCKKCSLYRACWEDEFYRSYRGMLDLCAKAENGVVSADDLEGDLARRCIRPDEVAQAANLAAGRERERSAFALRLKESRTLAELQLKELADLVSEMGADVPVAPPQAGQRWRRGSHDLLPYQVGVAKRPRRGGVVSGDSELIAELSPTRVVFGISDGMGVGPAAAWESGTAVSLLERLLWAGFSQSLAVRAVNTTLLLRSVDEHFATLDLLLLDRADRTMEIVKVAASPTFVRRRGQVFSIESRGLPVGIVEEVRFDPLMSPVEPGDIVVMATDGIMDTDPLGSEQRLKQFLLEMPLAEPRMMAETLLSFMLGDSQEGRDDALVMVILLGSGESLRRAQPVHESPVREWRRVTPVPLKEQVPRPRG